METPIVGLNLHGFTRSMACEAVDRALTHLLQPTAAGPGEHVHGGVSRQKKLSPDLDDDGDGDGDATSQSLPPLPDLPILTGFRGPEYVVIGGCTHGGAIIGEPYFNAKHRRRFQNNLTCDYFC